MDNSFLKTVHKAAPVDRIHCITAFLVLLAYAAIGTANIGEGAPIGNTKTCLSVLVQVILWLVIFALRFGFSYLRMKKLTDLRSGAGFGMGYGTVAGITRSGALPEGYYGQILLRMLPFMLVLSAAYFVSGNLRKDTAGYVIGGLCIAVPIIVLLLLTWCTTLRRTTRGIHYVVTMPLAIVRFVLGILEFVLLVKVVITFLLIVYAVLSGLVTADLKELTAIRSFPGLEQMNPIFVGLALAMGLDLYVSAEMKRAWIGLVAVGVMIVLLTGLMLKKEQSDYVTITKDEIILTESGRAEKLALSDISTYHQSADNQTLTITLRDGRSLSLISENNALGGRNTDSEDAAFFASYWAEIFRNAGISAE